MTFDYKIILALFLLLWLGGCASKKAVWQGVCRGVYDGANQYQEMRDAEPFHPLDQTPLTYGEYERQRQEMIDDQDNKDSGLWGAGQK